MLLLEPITEKSNKKFANSLDLESAICLHLSQQEHLKVFLNHTESFCDEYADYKHLYIPLVVVFESQYFRVKKDFPFTRETYRFLIEMYMIHRYIDHFELWINSLPLTPPTTGKELKEYEKFKKKYYYVEARHIFSHNYISTTTEGETILTSVSDDRRCPECGHICNVDKHDGKTYCANKACDFEEELPFKVRVDINFEHEANKKYK